MVLFENTILKWVKQIRRHNYLIQVLISGTFSARGSNEQRCSREIVTS